MTSFATSGGKFIIRNGKLAIGRPCCCKGCCENIRGPAFDRRGDDPQSWPHTGKFPEQLTLAITNCSCCPGLNRSYPMYLGVNTGGTLGSGGGIVYGGRGSYFAELLDCAGDDASPFAIHRVLMNVICSPPPLGDKKWKIEMGIYGVAPSFPSGDAVNPSRWPLTLVSCQPLHLIYNGMRLRGPGAGFTNESRWCEGTFDLEITE